VEKACAAVAHAKRLRADRGTIILVKNGLQSEQWIEIDGYRSRLAIAFSTHKDGWSL
jgi:hypothetical protein